MASTKKITYVGKPGNIEASNNDSFPQAKIINQPSIIKAGGVENGSVTIYTVPVGKNFTWLSLVMEASDVTAGGSQAYLKVGGVDIFGILTPSIQNAQTINQNFTNPPVLPSGTTFILRSEAGGLIAYASIVGYESQTITQF